MSFCIGLIGAGTHGTRYLRHASRDVPGMAVAGLCRRQEKVGQELAGQLNCRYFQEPSDLIAEPAVDGVIVCTPPSSHFVLAKQVLAVGKPLLLEKPFTGTLSEARKLVEITKSIPSAPVLVGHTLRWNPVLQKVKELLPQLGKIRLIRLAQRLAPTDLSWQRNSTETVGGSVLLTGVHLFDLVRWFTGAEFKEIDSRQDNLLNPVVEDIFLARGLLNNGVWVSLEVSKYTQSRACWLEIVGEAGQIHADYIFGGITLRCDRDEQIIEISAAAPTLPLILKDWLAAIRGDLPMPVSAADGFATMQVVDACYRSAESNRAVQVD